MVACTSGTPEKLARCRELGADLAISYRDEDFTKAVLDFTDGHGADVILDIMGAPYLAPNLAALATWGRLMVLSVRGGGRGEIDLGLLMAKRGSIFAATLRARPPQEKAEVVTATRQHVWPLIGAGQVAPVVWQVLPMAEAAQAHRLIESGAHIGKILLANLTGRAHPGCDHWPARRKTKDMSERNPEASQGPKVVVVGPDGIAVDGDGGDGDKRRRAPRHGDGRAASQGDADRQHDPAAAGGGPRRPAG